MADFLKEEPNMCLEGFMEDFGFTKSLLSHYEEILILEKDFSFVLVSLYVIIFFLIVSDSLQDYKRGKRAKESEDLLFWYKYRRFMS